MLFCFIDSDFPISRIQTFAVHLRHVQRSRTLSVDYVKLWMISMFVYPDNSINSKPIRIYDGQGKAHFDVVYFTAVYESIPAPEPFSSR